MRVQTVFSCTIFIIFLSISCSNDNTGKSGEPSPILVSASTQPDDVIPVSLRYYSFSVAPEVESLEANTGYASVDWQLPVGRTALVLVDVWNTHYLKDTLERIEDIMENNIAPLVRECRERGIKIIHAPGPDLAVLSPFWAGLVSKNEIYPLQGNWPPEEFRNRTGEYAGFRRRGGPVNPAASEARNIRAIHPLVEPVQGDVVISCGEELHRYCEQEGIVFLVFAGFHPNACLITRDYGIPSMKFDYGYETILLRDCTTAMETSETVKNLELTRNFITFFEMFAGYSLTSEEFMAGLRH